MAKTYPFDNYSSEYEKWFNDNHFAFLSELEAIRKVIPRKGTGVEIGIGSGIFAAPLGITEGCDPSVSMRKKAIERGINAIDGIAEKLPYKNKSYDFAIMVTTICFVDNPQKSIHEIYRILKSNGEIIIGFVDENSPIGRQYIKNKEKSLFYKNACFFSTDDIYKLLWDSDFRIENTCQTVFGSLTEIKQVQQTQNGCDKGSFVVIKAKKNE